MNLQGEIAPLFKHPHRACACSHRARAVDTLFKQYVEWYKHYEE